MNKAMLSLFLCLQLKISCEKQSIEDDCQILREGITANKPEKVRTAINRIISHLPSDDYIDANLQALVQDISSKRGATCELFCFDCIKTLPSQSEIRIQVGTGSSTIEKVIDISYTSANKMTFNNMHD